jgi:hypothetical protein
MQGSHRRRGLVLVAAERHSRQRLVELGLRDRRRDRHLRRVRRLGMITDERTSGLVVGHHEPAGHVEDVPSRSAAAGRCHRDGPATVVTAP